jgi:hypothetical protein
MSKILITAGPIPSRLDSVKYITNRFKGGLALDLASKLANCEDRHDVTLVAWKYSGIKSNLPTILVEDVVDYYEKVLDFEADAYILSAAVANLGPLEPIVGKFPSHKYKVGDVFPIEFTIMPRVIDAIKSKYPTSTLIAYKLFDGTDEELIDAARHTLYDSKANIVFANHPAWAKTKKIAVTADGAAFEMSYDDHVKLIMRLLREKFYKTSLLDEYWYSIDEDRKYIVNNYPKSRLDNLTFGTFAIRDIEDDGFITTTRGKRGGETETAYVNRVDHENLIVFASEKATLNAPLLDKILELNPQINYLIHSHENIGTAVQDEYQFPGTIGDLKNVLSIKADKFLLNLPYHGYIAGFKDFTACKNFIDSMNGVN